MEKRYQVFLSSTYEDLKEERLEITRALLEMDCIPCGMEYFPASSKDPWLYIKELITSCDYFVVVVAGCYGSTDSVGLSFTEKEYNCALEVGIPTLAFVHSDPGSLPAKRVESDEDAQHRLEMFKTKLQAKLCKYWSSSQQLGAVVSRSLVHLIETHPRAGWVRANLPPDTSQATVIGLHHVSLPVRDLEKSVDFYQNILRLRRRARPDFGFPGAWFEFPDGQQQLHLIQYQKTEDSPPTFRRSRDIDFKDVHFAIRVRDYNAMYEILSQCVEIFIQGPRQFQFYVLDPDSHIIEITGFDGPGPKRYESVG